MPGFWDTSGGEVFGDGVTSIWDRFVVAGRALPGVAQVEGVKSVRLDQRNAAGSDGATLSHLGNDGAEVTVRLQLWTPAHFDAWAIRSGELLAINGKARPKPVMIYHPSLAIHGIKSLYVKNVGLVRVQAGGLGEAILKFVEFLPVSKAGIVTPKAAINTNVKSVFNEKTGPTPVPPSKKAPGP
jgi:hypothetical protein